MNKAWWGLVDDELLSAFEPKDTASVVLGASYCVIGKDNSYQWGAGHPISFVNKLRGRQKSLPSLEYVAFGSCDQYFVQFKDGAWQIEGAPDKLLKTLKRWDNLSVDILAFAPDNGWYVKWKDGSYEWDGLPTRLHKKMNQSSESPGVVALTIGPQGEWFVRLCDGTWEYDNVPDACHERINKILEGGGDVEHIAFGHRSQWLITYEPGRPAVAARDLRTLPTDESYFLVDSLDAVKQFVARRQTRTIGGAMVCIESAVKITNGVALSEFASSGAFTANPLIAFGHADTILFHGTSEAAIANIQANGRPTMAYAANGMLGRGIYGAPDPRKSLQYCQNSPNGQFMFICRFNLSPPAKHAGPSTPHRNTIFDEFAVYEDRRVVVLWMLKVA